MIHHVALETHRADLDAELAFWAALGFRPVDPPATLRDRAAWVERDGQQIHLLFSDAPRTAGHVAIAGPWPPPVPHEQRSPHWGEPRAYARSPGGHLVEVMRAPPGPS